MRDTMHSILSALFGRSRAEADMADELAFHLQSRIDDLVAHGLTLEAAARQARIEFGGIELHKDRCREALGWRIIDEVRADVAYGARSLWQHPVFALVAILTLALGIGANTVMFGVIDALLLRPPAGVADPANIVRIYPEFRHPTGNTISLSSLVDLQSLEPNSLAGTKVAAYHIGAERLGGDVDTDSPLVRTVFVSREYFQVLGVRPALGRFFSSDEQANEAAAHEVVISNSLWRSQFGANPGVIGKSVTLGGLPLRVVGIAPSSFAGVDLDPPDVVWLPLALARNGGLLGRYMTASPGHSPETYRWLRLLAYVAPGTSRAGIATQVATRLRESEQAANDRLPPGEKSAYRVVAVTIAPLSSHFGAPGQPESPVSL